jgi:16S rRNA (adenine1518-N6/adenine1519-N6)-dimethyltransferase
VEILSQDVLDLSEEYLKKLGEYKIVANLPYNISSFFLRKFLSAKYKPTSLVLMLQKEVAERLSAKPGDMSLLSVSAQFYSHPEVVAIVPSSAFWPEPKVDSALIRIILKKPNELPGVDEKLFFRLVKVGYSAKRKMLKNNLGNGLHLPVKDVEETMVNVGLNPNIRAQELSVSDWLNLFAKISVFMV